MTEPATRQPVACPGSGGGYVEVYGWDRHTAEYWEPCELCGRSHRDNRPPPPWYDHLWEPWRSIAEWLVVRRKP